jgi:hypothetical protein
MDTLFALFFLSSLILLIIGFFSPKTSLFWDKKERTKKKSGLVYGGLTLLFLILLGAVNDPSKSDTATKREEKSSTQTQGVSSESTTEAKPVSSDNPQETKVSYNKIGDQIEIGNFSYVVNNASFAKSVGNEFAKETADGIFLIVNMTFRNNDNEEHTLDNSFFKLTDENGTEFETSNDGSTALEMSHKPTLFLKQCNPQITKSGFIIFEVPEKKVYDLHLSGGFWSGKTALVKLTTK